MCWVDLSLGILHDHLPFPWIVRTRQFNVDKRGAGVTEVKPGFLLQKRVGIGVRKPLWIDHILYAVELGARGIHKKINGIVPSRPLLL